MEIGMKEDMVVADEMSLSNLVARSTGTLSQSATKCTYLHFMPLEGRIVIKICVMEDMGVVEEITSSTIK